MPNGDGSYEVGYGKPPKGGQFAKGRSGNGKGRPKGSKNLATLVLKESRQFVKVNGPSGSRKVTKMQAAIMQLSNKSAQGDPRATREFLGLVQRSEEQDATQPKPTDMHESDQKTMQSLLKRMQASMTNTNTQPKEEQ